MLHASFKYPLLLMALAGMAWSIAASAARPSPADCAAVADRVARDTGSTLGGATRGAAKGAIFGAIVGDSKSARRGAALGAVVGAGKRHSDRNYVYERTYDDCMRGNRY